MVPPTALAVGQTRDGTLKKSPAGAQGQELGVWADLGDNAPNAPYLARLHVPIMTYHGSAMRNAVGQCLDARWDLLK
jgi:hypothetical protein